MAIGFYKVLELPTELKPSSIYYVVESLEDEPDGEDVFIHRLFVTTKSIPVEPIPLNAVTKNEFTTELAKKFASPKGTIEQYVRGDGTLGNIESLSAVVGIIAVKQKKFVYDGENNSFNIGEKVKSIWNIGADTGSNYEKYVISFNEGDTSVTIDTDTAGFSVGNEIKIEYIPL